MKRILFLLLVIGLTAGTTAMAGMSTSKVRKETRFLTDKMAYELSLTTPQYNDLYEINYDFIYSVRNIMDNVVRGDEWALDDYYEALDIRNDDLRWVLSDAQYRRFLGIDYFYRPIYVTGGRWSFRIYVNYPNRSLFYFGVPYHYRTYCGAHYRPYIHHASFYRDRYHFNHYPTPHRVRDQRVFHSYRRSDFGSVRFRPNTSVRPHNAPTRPGTSTRPSTSTRPRPESNRRPSTSSDRPSTPSRDDRPKKDFTPDRNEGHRPANGTSTTTRPKPESGRTDNSSNVRPSRRNDSSSHNGTGSSSRRDNSSNRESNFGRNNGTGSSERNNNSSSRNNSRSERSNSHDNSSRSSERGNSSRR